MTDSDTTPVVQHPCPQPQPKQLEHPSVRDPLADQREQSLVVDLAEEVLDVGLEDEGSSLDEADPDPLQGVDGRTLRAEPEAAGQEVGLEDGFEDELRCLLDHPVLDRRDAQWPLRAVGLGNLHPAHWCRVVVACTEGVPEFAEQTLDPVVVLHGGEGQMIDPGRPTIGSDPLPRLPQDVTPVDAVIQGVETPTLRLLGRSP